MLNKLIVIIVAISLFSSAFAAGSSPPPKRFEPQSRSHTWKEKGIDMTVMTVGMVVVYVTTQYDIVMDKSTSSWKDNVFDKGAVFWDEDEWTWNFVGHPIGGSEYYLYFRSRGYAPKWAFVGTLISSTIHEELVESWSEPFSFNDFVITPTLGSLLGYGREKAAMRLLHTDNKFNRFVGRVLWFETNFWFFEDFEVIPAVTLDRDTSGFTILATW